MNPYNGIYPLLLKDAPTLLALAGCWTNPFEVEDEFMMEEESLFNAWRFASDMFPDVAAGVTWAMWEGHSQKQIERQLSDEFRPLLPGQLSEIELIPYGPEYNYYGIDWQTSFPEEIPPLSPEQKQYGKLLNMIDHERSPYHHLTMQNLADRYWTRRPDLSAFVQLNTSISGNTLIDYTRDEALENGYDIPEWSFKTLEFAWDVQIDADTFFDLAQTGKVALRQTETYLQFCEELILSNCFAISEVHHVPKIPYQNALYGSAV